MAWEAAIKRMSNLQKLNALIGVVSGASLGGAIGVSIVRFYFGMYAPVFVVPSILMGAIAGFLIAYHCPQEQETDTSTVVRQKVLEVMVAVYHLGAVVLFVSFIAWRLEAPGWPIFDRDSTIYLHSAVIGYAFLRLWILLHDLWRRFAKTEPLFFWGLFLGTFPSLFFAFGGSERLSWLYGLLSPVRVLLSIPGRAANLFSSIYWDSFRELSASVLCASLSWAFVFFLVDQILHYRRARQPNMSVPAGRDPRERGSRPLNSDR